MTWMFKGLAFLLPFLLTAYVSTCSPAFLNLRRQKNRLFRAQVTALGVPSVMLLMSEVNG